jgi:hypothetical protein
MDIDHGAGDGFAGGVGVESAVDLMALSHERGKPTGVCSGAGGGDVKAIGVKGKAAERIGAR